MKWSGLGRNRLFSSLRAWADGDDAGVGFDQDGLAGGLHSVGYEKIGIGVMGGK